MIIIQNDLTVFTINGAQAENYDSNSLPEGWLFVLDENSKLGQKIMTAGLFVEPVIDNGKLIDVTAKNVTVKEKLVPSVPESQPNLEDRINDLQTAFDIIAEGVLGGD